MTELSMTEARKDFSGTVDRIRVDGERIVLVKNGKRVAAIISVDDFAMLQAIEDQEDIAEIERVKALGDDFVPLDEALESVGIK